MVRYYVQNNNLYNYSATCPTRNGEQTKSPVVHFFQNLILFTPTSLCLRIWRTACWVLLELEKEGQIKPARRISQ